MKSRRKIIISCEHGGNQVPAEYQNLFRGKKSILESHRGLDHGALTLARKLSAKIRAPLFSSTTTRLLVDLNRSRHHRQLFSEFTRDCREELKTEILKTHYYPYRQKLEKEILKNLANDRMVIHLSIHSFTQKLGGEMRRADVGLLFDPQCKRERELCRKLQNIFNVIDSELLVRMNYPYRGTADGLTTTFRKKFAGRKYLGIEIEVNQNYSGMRGTRWNNLLRQIVHAIELATRQE